ncbi:MAG: 3-dehydroquinate synthase [Planctomycetota bacterium]|nr:3-dehydroquinate synthase [Planctomycetota bacterium]MDA1213035.1 3-dehydroquinate synthase [Planctomycetota bacterium]
MESFQQCVTVRLGPRSYDIVISTGELSSVGEAVQTWMNQKKKNGSATLVVTDEHVNVPHAQIVTESLRKAGLRTNALVLAAGEQEKNLASVQQIYDELIRLQADRQTVVIAVGGGVIGDMAGFAAATYARGVPFVQVPTTLLAHVDSSVGGKVGVNHPSAKNMIGAFYQPLGVLIDTSTLDSLPEREYRSGLAEVVKYGVILDDTFFADLEEHVEEINRREPAYLRSVIARCCRLKANVVEHDEYETTGLRACLNYGHTFGHAFEALSNYGELLHGEGVSIGMIFASRLAEQLGLIDQNVTNRQIELLQAIGLPTALPENLHWTADEIIERMRLDKKAVAGRLRFVLPTQLGEVQTFSDVDELVVRRLLS